jgi:hypothetical protein
MKLGYLFRGAAGGVSPATSLIRSLARNAASIAQRLLRRHALSSLRCMNRKKAPQMNWVTDGDRWRAWLVDYNAAGPGDRIARRSTSAGEISQSNVRLESARPPPGRVALSERVAEIVIDRHPIDR